MDFSEYFSNLFSNISNLQDDFVSSAQIDLNNRTAISVYISNQHKLYLKRIQTLEQSLFLANKVEILTYI